MISAKDFRFAAFVGRRRELATLVELGKRAQQGHGAIALVDGEHGVGKTRLIQQFLLELGAANAFAMTSMPMLLLGAWPADTQTVREIPQLAPAELEARRDQPTILIFDDLGSASAETFQTLERAAHLSLLNPWLVVASYENNFVDGARNGLARVLLRMIGLGASEISVKPLAAADMWLLLGSVAQTVPQDHLEYVQRTARGNPMYASELLRRSGDAPATSRPLLTFADAIGRISELDPDARDALNAASILGDRFEEAHLAAMVKLPEEMLVRVLDRLVALRAVEPQGNGAYAFCSGVDRAAICDALLPAHRRLLHASAVDVLLRVQPRRSVELAWHAYEAQLPASAAYIVEAAQAEQQRGNFGETLRLLRAGLSIVGSEDRRQFVQLLANAMYLGASGYHSIKPLLDELHDTQTPPPVEEIAVRYQRELFGLMADCDGEGMRRAIEEALGLPAGPAQVLAHLRMVVARALAMIDRFDEARAVLSSVLEPARDDVRYRAPYVLALAIATRTSENHADALASLRDAIPQLWESNPFGACLAAGTLATLMSQEGDLAAAWQIMEETLQKNRDLGERAVSAVGTVSTLAELNFLRGDFESARDALAQQLGKSDLGMHVRVDLASNALLIGAALRDEVLLKRFEDEGAFEAALRFGATDSLGRIAYGLCELYSCRGQRAKLRSVLTRVLDAARIVDKCYFIALATARFGSAADVARAKRLVAASPWRMPFARAHETLFRAFIASRSGQRTESLRLSQRAREIYEKAGWMWHATIARRVAEGKRANGALSEGAKVRLTSREAEIARLAADGMGNDDIAGKLGISPKTAGNHLMAAFAKLNVHSRRELKYHLAEE